MPAGVNPPMKLFIRWLVRIVASLLVLLLIAATIVYLRSNSKLAKRYSITATAPAVNPSAELIERGRYLAITRGCTDCHGKDLAGAVVIDDPAMGHLGGPNLTRGRGGLPASYKNEDWARAIIHGVGSDGRPLVLMPSTDFSAMSDADLSAILAYANSVPAVDRDSPKLSLGPVARVLLVLGKLPLSVEEIDHANIHPSQIVPAPTAAYGQYLAAGCTGCHGPNFSGGKIAIGPPDWPPAANLTPHASSNLSKWTEADFISTVRSGHRPDGSELNKVMPRNFGLLNDIELKALWAFLHTVPPAPTGQR